MILITFGFSRATHVMEKIVRTSINSTIDRFNRIQICTVFFLGVTFHIILFFVAYAMSYDAKLPLDVVKIL